ncbi:MAG: hypothetical protein AB7N24_00435 [Dehalococcoidia bacterium]
MPRWLTLAACVLAIAALLAACGDDDGGDSGSDPSKSPTNPPPSGTVSTASPQLSKPAGKYSVSLDDIGNAWLTDIANTYVISSQSYCRKSCLFASQTEGEKDLESWGYVEGYETAYIPEGRDDTVLKGGYYIKVETHLFETAEGANAAFDYFTAYAASGAGSAAVQISPVGNKSAGFETLGEKLGNTRVNAVYEQILFVRGNVLTVVLTKGAQGFMTPKEAWDLAVIADEKLLGERAAPEPTPTSNYKTPTPEPTKQ